MEIKRKNHELDILLDNGLSDSLNFITDIYLLIKANLQTLI